MKEGYSDIELDLEKELLFDLMFLAHERDITLNQLVENILREYLKKNKDAVSWENWKMNKDIT
jgi:hypothetical protein